MTQPLRYLATDRQTCLAVLLAIASHPLIQNPPILNPIRLAGVTPEPMRIVKFRDYAGRELPEQGLTLSVFPTEGGDYGGIASTTFEPYTLGDQEPGEYFERGRMRLTIQLALLDADFDIPYTVNYKVDKTKGWVPHGERITLVDPEEDPEDVEEFEGTDAAIEIVMLPAEMILRDYLTLLRGIIRDTQTFKPFSLRNPQIRYVNYPTTAVFGDQAENLVFHKADLVVEFDVYESNFGRALFPESEQLHLVKKVYVDRKRPKPEERTQLYNDP